MMYWIQRVNLTMQQKSLQILTTGLLRPLNEYISYEPLKPFRVLFKLV